MLYAVLYSVEVELVIIVIFGEKNVITCRHEVEGDYLCSNAE